jgi:hypothetical protein
LLDGRKIDTQIKTACADNGLNLARSKAFFHLSPVFAVKRSMVDAKIALPLRAN